MFPLLRKTIWLAIFVTGLGWVVIHGLQTVAHENRTQAMLLAVQSALQDFHVDQEQYIPREKLTGSEMISVLADFEFLETLPINPWTKQPWKLDGEEPDYLVYQTDPNFETYSLRAMHPKTGEVYMELDSEENRSLE